MSETLKVLPWKGGAELAKGALSPNILGKVGGVAENPDEAVRKKGLGAFEAMERKDAHYSAVLQTRKLALLGKGYEIQSASQDAGDEEVAAFVRWNFERMRGSFLQDLLEILDGLGKGFSLSELVWSLAEGGPWPGKVLLQRIKAKDQSQFGFDLDEYDNIADDGIIQNPMVNHGLRLTYQVSEDLSRRLSTPIGIGGESERLPRDKFVHFVFNGRAENPYGRGLGGLCYWYSWFKSEGGYKFWLVFLEKFGSPTSVLQKNKEYVSSGSQSNDNTELKKILQSVQQETGVVLPPGLELKLLEAARSGEGGYQNLIRQCNDEISKAVLGQTLTTEQGDRGARALGQVHQQILFDLLQFDAEALQTAVNEQIIQRLVDYNFAGVEAYPRFVIPLKVQQDPETFTAAVEKIVNMGAQVPARYVHEELGVPMAEDGEPVLGKSVAVAPSPVGSPPVEPFAERKISQGQLFPAARRHAFAEAQADLIEAGAARGRYVVEQALQRAIASVRDGDYIAQRAFDGEIKLDIRPLRDTLFNTAVLAFLTGQAQAVDELADKGVEFPAERLESFAEEAPEILGPKEAIEDFRNRVPLSARQFNRLTGDLKRKYFTVAGIEETSLLKLIQTALIEAIETGSTVEAFRLAVEQAAVPYTGTAFGSDLAGQALKDSHIRLIFRNATMSAYNEGRRRIFEDPDVADAIPFYMYNAIDDDRARPSHAAMDGRIYAKDHPIWGTWWPPNGHNCRCTVTPVSRIEARRLAEEDISTAAPVVDGTPAAPDKGFGGSTHA